MKLEVGKYYRTAEGDKVGPMLVYGGYDDSFHYESDEYGRLWKTDGTRYFGDGGGTIVAEWVAPLTLQSGKSYALINGEWRLAAPSVDPAQTTFKVGDRVRFTEHNPNCGKDFGAEGDYATVEYILEYETPHHGKQVSVRLDKSGNSANVPIKALVLAGSPSPTVGDWVRDEEGRIGIVFHDDGDDYVNLKVGTTEDGDVEYYSARDLTIVPPGTKQADNDNAAALQEIEELEERLSSLRASTA